MKIARFQSVAGGEALWGVVDPEANEIRPILEAIDEFGPRLAADPTAMPKTGAVNKLDSVRLLAPMTPATKIIGAGANYMQHLRRRGRTEAPKQTQAYLKPATAIVGPDDEIAYPATTSQLDFEVELVAVIGSVRLTAEAKGSHHLLGYTVGNDVSARDATTSLGSGLDLFSMKALDRTTPLGPWIVTVDEVGGPGQPDLEIRLSVNGEERQRDRTSQMIFGIDELIEFVTRRVTMCAGDVLFTGTTGGVGNEDKRFLEPGDVVVAEIERVGRIENRVGPRPTEREI